MWWAEIGVGMRAHRRQRRSALLVAVLAPVLVGAMSLPGGRAAAITLNPGSFPAPRPTPTRTLTASVTELAPDPLRPRLYGLTTGDDAERPNAVVAIDTDAWAVTTGVALPRAGTGLAVTDDGAHLLVADGTGGIGEYALPGLTRTRTITLPAGAVAPAVHPLPGGGSAFLAVLQVAPDPSDVLVVFDGPTARPATVGVPQGSGLTLGAGGRLYATGGSQVQQFLIGPTGVTTGWTVAGDVLTPAVVEVDGAVFTGDGRILDPLTGALVASDAGPFSHAPLGATIPRRLVGDPAAHRVWALSNAGSAVGNLYLDAVDSVSHHTLATFSAPPTREIAVLGPARLAVVAGPRVIELDAAETSGAAGEYTPLTPARILDTRDGTGQGGTVAPIGPEATIDLRVAGQGGVPATGVAAVVINLTATEPTASGFLTVWPTGGTRPVVSSVNFTAGRTVPNLVTVPLGVGGSVRIFNHAGTTHAVADAVGFYSTSAGPAGARFHPLTPSRLFDTRPGLPPSGGAIGAGGEVTLDVRGLGGIPRTDVRAVILNVTVADPAGPGFLTVYPGDVARPLASNLNYLAGQTVPNLVIVRVPADGVVRFYGSGSRTDVIADVVGYFDSDRSTEHGRYVTQTPERLVDTRIGLGGTYGGLPDGVQWTTPYAITAAVVNVTVVEPPAPGFLTLYPTKGRVPLASNVNFVAGQVVANAAVAVYGSIPAPSPLGAIGTFGAVFAYSSVATDVVVDEFGWFS